MACAPAYRSAPCRRRTRIRGSVGGNTDENRRAIAIKNSGDASQIHPSQIRVGDIIGTTRPVGRRYTVKLISGPQTAPRQWTFFGRDTEGLQHTTTFGEHDFVSRYA